MVERGVTKVGPSSEHGDSAPVSVSIDVVEKEVRSVLLLLLVLLRVGTVVVQVFIPVSRFPIQKTNPKSKSVSQLSE